MNEKPNQKRTSICGCGKPLTGEDATFWGECEKCRLNLPVKTGNSGGDAGANADREYHGGRFNKGEW